jgi:hypothetical protein
MQVSKLGGIGVFHDQICSSSREEMDVMLAIEVLGLVKTVLRIEVKKWSCETAWCSEIVGARHCDVAVMA